MTIKRPKTKTVQCGFCNRLRPAKDIEWDRGVKQWVCRDADGCAATNLRKLHRAAPKPDDVTRPPAPKKEDKLICACCGGAGRHDRTIHRDGFGVGPEVPLCSACANHPEPLDETIWKNIHMNRELLKTICRVLGQCKTRRLGHRIDRGAVAAMLSNEIIRLRIRIQGL